MFYPKLNSLRAIAIALFLIEHFAHAIGSNFSAGYYGVDLFFVLSGFLITNILIKENGKTNLKNWFNLFCNLIKKQKGWTTLNWEKQEKKLRLIIY